MSAVKRSALLRVLGTLIPRAFRDQALGDLEERYEHAVRPQVGPVAARAQDPDRPHSAEPAQQITVGSGIPTDVQEPAPVRAVLRAQPGHAQELVPAPRGDDMTCVVDSAQEGRAPVAIADRRPHLLAEGLLEQDHRLVA